MLDSAQSMESGTISSSHVDNVCVCVCVCLCACVCVELQEGPLKLDREELLGAHHSKWHQPCR